MDFCTCECNSPHNAHMKVTKHAIFHTCTSTETIACTKTLYASNKKGQQAVEIIMLYLINL